MYVCMYGSLLRPGKGLPAKWFSGFCLLSSCGSASTNLVTIRPPLPRYRGLKGTPSPRRVLVLTCDSTHQSRMSLSLSGLSPLLGAVAAPSLDGSSSFSTVCCRLGCVMKTNFFVITRRFQRILKDGCSLPTACYG